MLQAALIRWQTGDDMGIDPEILHNALDILAADNPPIAAALDQAGYPAPRHSAPGYRTLLRTIVGQQVSVAAANTVWGRLENLLGEDIPVDALLATDDEALRACGLSRQKQNYLRSLCSLVADNELNLHQLPTDDEAAIAELTRIKGIGRWSAEIYLLFAEGRPDIWPAGDLGIQAGLQLILDLPERPNEKALRAMGQDWRPHRGAMAVFSWHFIKSSTL